MNALAVFVQLDEEILLSQVNAFGTELMSLIVKHDLETEYGVPTHIIYQIMVTSFDNYRTIFRNLEEFYMKIEQERQENASMRDLTSETA